MGSLKSAADILWKLSLQSIFHRLREKPENIRLKKELKRITRLKRHTVDEAKLNGFIIKFNDKSSFIYQHNEIFIKENYKFNCNKSVPLIYDCGANIGMSVLYFKKLFANAKIKAFEPDPDIFSLLQLNAAKNSLDDVELINKAIWTENKVLPFGRDGADGGSFYKKDNLIQVEGVRLKELIEKEDFVDLLKLDVEGAETEILNDCKNSLKNVSRIFIEYHTMPGRTQSLDQILSVLTGAQFIYFLQPISEDSSPFMSVDNPDFNGLQVNIYASKV